MNEPWLCTGANGYDDNPITFLAFQVMIIPLSLCMIPLSTPKF
jgi:hypothetical protein